MTEIRRNLPRLMTLIALLIAGLMAPAKTMAQRSGMYEVTITNLTRGQQFTPILIATHPEGVRLFDLGAQASSQLEELAENGGTGPLTNLLAATPGVLDIQTSAGLLDPGQSVTVRIRGGGGILGGVGRARNFSLAGMLIPTNDGFVSIDDAPLPRGKQPLTLYALAYDAGTERNDELCESIPGPFFDECNGPGTGGAPSEDAEGYVHIHAGIHGIGDMDEAARDWRNPVARITVRRMR